jgi:diguanylate cyclase (GGDEF)-like protein/PAS domain S-box-containing protein
MDINSPSKVSFTGLPHDKVVFDVLNGKSDVGFVRTGILENMAREDLIQPNQLKVLNRQSIAAYPQILSTELYPEWPFSVMPTVDQELVKKVTLALLQIKPFDQAAQLGKYHGFSPPGNYSTVEALMRHLNVNPELAHEFNLHDVVRKYALKLVGVGIVLLLLAIGLVMYFARINHKLRVSYADAQRLDEELTKSNETLEEKVATRTQELQESEKLSKNAVAELQLQKLALDEHAIVSVTDVKGRITHVNDRFCQISEYTREELIGKNHSMLNSGIHPKGFFKNMYRIVTRGKVWHNEVCNRAKNGGLYWLDMTVVPFMNEFNKPYQYIAIRTDITSRKESEEAIMKLAFYDPLTNLPNRRLLVERVQRALLLNTRTYEHGAILFIDLDNFKNLNDTKGHAVGDLLLIEVAKRLRACIREEDTVARLGGDEFVLLLENLGAENDVAGTYAERVGQKILNELNNPYVLDGYEHYSSPSIGVTLFSDNSENVDDLLKRADSAMYQSKKAGRNTVRFYDPRTQAVLVARNELETALRHAVENQELQLYYQIQVDENYTPIGAEVLLRWQHPTIGMVSPAQFIPLAEETGLIVPIGLWVLETSCAQLKLWENNSRVSSLVLAVNVSVRQFREPNFVAEVRRIIEINKIDPSRLKLEITESMIVDNVDATISTMQELKGLGIKFSMDDFGTGYSSLSSIKRLPLDQLKIDQSFVRDIQTDAHDKVIVRTIIAMAESMHLNIIAEGVETEVQRNLLALKGCSNYQGYLFGKPVPIEQFEALIALN